MESSFSSNIVFSLSAWRNPEEGQAAPHQGKIALVELGLVGALLIAPIEMVVFAILIPMTALLYPISRAPMDWAIRGVVSSQVALRFGLSGLVNNIAKDRLPASEAEWFWDLFARGSAELGFEGLTQNEKADLKGFDEDTFCWFGTSVVYRLAFGDLRGLQVPRGQLPNDLIQAIEELKTQEFHFNEGAEWLFVDGEHLSVNEAERLAISALQKFKAHKAAAAANLGLLPGRIQACHNTLQESFTNPKNSQTWIPFISLGQNA